ncbi:MAG: hypothetical protein GY941_26410 [Planctomycetes bacterium]|nr:hypothetical protein [Planctomycetota bacterium]
MKQNLWERFLLWWCETFGHKPNDNDKWQFEDKTHSTCMRCKRVITARYDMAYGCTDWE